MINLDINHITLLQGSKHRIQNALLGPVVGVDTFCANYQTGWAVIAIYSRVQTNTGRHSTPPNWGITNRHFKLLGIFQ